jgi:ACS family tartrate transporter-like MFS transporter
VLSKLTKRLVPFLFLLYIVAYLDRINVGFAALPMQQQLGFSDAVYGRGAGIFFLGYFLFQIPSNLILQKLGARLWVSVLMVSWGVISCCMMLVKTPSDFFTLRFLLGLAEAGFFPGIILYLKNWVPIEARARTMAWFITAGPVAGIVGGPISGALLGVRGHGMAGWQWLFLLEGIPAILLGATVLFYLAETPRDVAWLGEEERQWLVTALNPKDSARAQERSSAWQALLNGKIWLLALIFFGVNTSGYGVTLWLPKLINSVSTLNHLALGFASSVPYIVAAIAMVLVGIHSDRTGERRWHAALPAFLAATSLAIVAYSSSLVSMVAGLSVAVLSVYSISGPFWALSTAFLKDSSAAAGIALINAIGNLGGFCGPYIIGTSSSSAGGFRSGLLVLGATIGSVGGLLLLVGSRESVVGNLD